MSWDTRAILPNRISGQIAILILTSLIAIHAILTAGFLLSRDRLPPPGGSGELITIIRALAAMPRDARAGALTEIAAAFPDIGLKTGENLATADARAPSPPLDLVRRQLGTDFVVTPVDAPDDEGVAVRNRSVAIRLPDGDVLAARLAPVPKPPAFGGPLFMTLLFVIISVTLLAVWAARSLSRPLTQFVKAAEGFNPDADVAPIPENGPVEIRSAARALNRMRQRVKNLVEDRTRVLAAMSHDLRTPITRMRLRTEFIPDSSLRAHMLNDLDQMRAMIEAVLTYLRDGKSAEQPTRVDIAILLQTVCDQFTDMGREAAYIGPAHAAIDARPDDLQRAVDNLVDNATRYGGGAVVRLVLLPSAARIDVEDEGPGIAESERAAMLEPFVRGDAARGMNDAQGFGLGLAIARAVVEAHRGTLTLHGRTPRGLLARIELPPGGLSALTPRRNGID